MIVLLHGFMDSWRTWDLVRPRLRGETLAPALPGHLGGPPASVDMAARRSSARSAPGGGPPASVDMADHLERVLDEAGVEKADLVGTSLGGYLALVLAARGRARSVVALAPAGGGDHTETLALQRRGVLLSEFAARPLPPQAIANLTAAVRATDMSLLDRAAWPLDARRVRCPVRILWGLEDRLLPWPAAAERYRRELDAEWIELDGVGHAPQLEIPLETAQLIEGFTTERIASSNGPSSSPFSR